MRELSPDQQRYLEQRLRQIRWWNRLGWLLPVLLLAGYAWLWEKHPLFVNPMFLLEKLRMGGVADLEMARLATLGNLAFLGCGALVAGLVLVIYASLWTESVTIRRLTAAPPPEAPASEEKSDAGPQA